MYDKLLESYVISEGTSRSDYTCTNCGNDRCFEFDFIALHELTEHEGQGVEGSVSETVRVDSGIPEITQCGICGALYRVEKEDVIFRDYRESVIDINTGEVVKRGALEKKYQVENIDTDLEELFKSISITPMGIPKRT